MMVDPANAQAYEFIFRSTADGILICHEGVITHANPAALGLLDVTLDRLIGGTPGRIFRTNPVLVTLFTRDDDCTFDVKLPRHRLAVGIGTTLQDYSRIVLLQDVTEKRALESRRESLVTSIAHDLRNPINAIGGFAELVGKFGDLNDQQQHFVIRIRQTSTKLYELAESLVDLAWMEAGMAFAHVPLHLEALIERARTELSNLALERRIAFAVSVQTPMPVIMGDPERIYQVVFHVLHNAVLYSCEDQVVAIHAWSDDVHVYCSVADQGIGIAEEELELVFDRLYRSRDERVRDISGGGLGLTIARTIIRRHGGNIWATSTPGEGSTFTFMLPITQL